MDIICINDNFTMGQETYVDVQGLETPVKGVIYTIRSIVNYPNGEPGLLLNEIINPPSPRKSKTTGITGTAEQTWRISRFSTLLGEPLKKEHLKQPQYA